MAASMRGLNQFIGDIRNCSTKDQEQRRVFKEMSNIRQKFKGTKVDGYQKKKYVSKLMYMYMLGYEVNFGHMEAVSLLSSTKYSEKSIGYLACAMLLNEDHELVTLIINSILRDITGHNGPPRVTHQCLALTCVANIGGRDMAEALAPTIQRLLVSPKTSAFVKKKAALALLRLYRKHPMLTTPDGWHSRVCHTVEDKDLGVITSSLALLHALVVQHGCDEDSGFAELYPKLIELLNKMVIVGDFSQDYLYYHIASPWIVVKTLKLMQLFPPPTSVQQKQRISDILLKIISMEPTLRSSNHRNAVHAVFFEAVHLVVHLEFEKDLLEKCVSMLGRMIQATETNSRYLGLEGLGRIARLHDHVSLKRFQKTVLHALKDADISIRQQALDLLFLICDASNVEKVVSELLLYLNEADFAIREEVVLKIAIVSEKYCVSESWYVDVLLQVITVAGDFVSEDIWYRVVQFVTNGEPSLQKYAVQKLYDAIQSPFIHETCVKVASYVLGEFGELSAVQREDQFHILHSKFPLVSNSTKSLLLTAYAKMVARGCTPELLQKIQEVFKRNGGNIDAEIQQRSIEYYQMSLSANALRQTVWERMPQFPQRESILEKRLRSLGEDEEAVKKEKAVKEEEEKEEQPKISLHGGEVVAPRRGGGGDLLGGDDLIGDIGIPPSAQETTPSEDTLLADLDLSSGPSMAVELMESIVDAPMPAQPVVDLMRSDLLVAPTQPSSAAPAVPKESSLLGEPAVAAKPVASSGSAADAFYRRLCLSAEGVMFEDEAIQIGMKSELKGRSLRLMFYFGNKTGSPFTQFSVTIGDQAGLKIKKGNVPTLLESRTQVQQLVEVEFASIFDESPTLDFFFISGNHPHRINTHLPVLVMRFAEPFPLLQPEFFKRWKTYGQDHEKQSIFPYAQPLNFPAMTKLFSVGYHFAVLANVDPNPNNLVCSGILDVEGEEPVMILLRLEVNTKASMMRLSTRVSARNDVLNDVIHRVSREQLSKG